MNVHAQPMKAHMLIGGELVAGQANNWIDSVNPANEEKIGEVPAGDAADVNKAVAAAEKAQPAWRHSTSRSAENICTSSPSASASAPTNCCAPRSSTPATRSRR